MPTTRWFAKPLHWHKPSAFSIKPLSSNCNSLLQQKSFVLSDHVQILYTTSDACTVFSRAGWCFFGDRSNIRALRLKSSNQYLNQLCVGPGRSKPDKRAVDPFPLLSSTYIVQVSGSSFFCISGGKNASLSAPSVKRRTADLCLTVWPFTFSG